MNTHIKFFLPFFLFSALTVLGNDNTSLSLIQADSLIQVKNYELAHAKWKEIIETISESNPNYSFYQSKLSFCNAKLAQASSEYIEAITNYERVLSLVEGYKQKDKIIPYLVDVYNGLYHCLAYSGQWQKSLEVGNEGLALLNSEIDMVTRANYIYDLGYINDRLSKFHDAIKLYNQSIEYYLESNSDKNFDIGLAYNNLGTSYNKIGFFTGRLKSLEMAKEYWEKTESVSPSYLLTIYGNLIKLYMEYGDVHKVTELYNSIEKISTRLTLPNEKSSLFRLRVIYDTFTNRSWQVEKRLNEFSNYFKLLPEKDKNTNVHHYLASLTNVGDYFITQKESTKAKIYLEKSLRLSKDYNQPYYSMNAYSSMSKIFMESENYDIAIHYLDKAKGIHEVVNIGEVNLTNILIKKANLEIKQGSVDKANLTLFEALSILANDTITSPIQITVDDFKNRNSSFFILAIKSAAEFYKEKYTRTKKNEDVRFANYLYELSARVFSNYYQNGEYNPSLNELNKSINEGLLETLVFQKKGLSEEILRLIESNNSQVLRNEFEKKQLKYLNNSEDIILRRNLLQLELEELKKDSLVQEIANIEKQLNVLDAEIVSKDPMYFSFLKEEVSIQKIRHNIKANDIIIKYVLGSNRVYVILISKKNVSLYDLTDTKSLKNDVTELYKLLQDPRKSTDILSKKVYQHLLAPLQKELSQYTNLTIIPDEFLYYLPFETLSSGNALVLETHRTNYSYSLALWLLLNKTVEKSSLDKKMLVAFAPEYDGTPIQSSNSRNGRFDKIDGATKEAKQIVGLFNGDLYEKNEASVENFIKTTGLYKVYHLAMHALLDTENDAESSLVFQNNHMFGLKTLYKLHFPAELVVLSACSTGVGMFVAGEGLLSLSRALAFSGVRSSVYSLWDVPDEETSELMVSFYKFLDDGKDKDEALKMAKLDFIKNNPLKSHPYYWAGFVINGDINPISEMSFPNFWKYGAFILIITGIIIGFYKRKSNIK